MDDEAWPAEKDERAAMLGTSESSREKMDGMRDWERAEVDAEGEGCGGGISTGWKSDTRVRAGWEGVEEEVAMEDSRTKGVLLR